MVVLPNCITTYVRLPEDHTLKGTYLDTRLLLDAINGALLATYLISKCLWTGYSILASKRTHRAVGLAPRAG